jgi:hypothetical protein
MRILEEALTQLDVFMERARREEDYVSLSGLIEASTLLWGQLNQAHFASAGPRLNSLGEAGGQRQGRFGTSAPGKAETPARRSGGGG